MPLLVSAVKRMMDISISLIVLTLLLPFILIVSLIIKWEDGGYPFYFQKRVGLRGREFWIYKFRTMVVDAEKDTGAVLQTAGDARVTKIGTFLRNTRLDEIPNFVNVLLGHMSVVGPRAERPEIYNQVAHQFPVVRKRTKYVKPGITGEAQLALRSDGSMDKNGAFYNALPDIDRDQPENVVRFKQYYDFAYAMKMHSLWSMLKTDISIMFRTPYVMFFNRNVV